MWTYPDVVDRTVFVATEKKAYDELVAFSDSYVVLTKGRKALHVVYKPFKPPAVKGSKVGMCVIV